MHHEDLDTDAGDAIRLPAPPPAPPRPAIPLLTAVAPVIGAVVLWRLTGSVYSLWFAALGTVLAIAGFADGLRGSRRVTRRARRQAATELAAIDAALAERHADERRRAWARTPDVAGYCAAPDEIWRQVPGREEVVVVGRGTARSAVRVDGEPHDDAARAVRRRARLLEDAPVAVPLRAGIAVCGPAPAAAAVARALALQVCLAHPPGRVRVVGAGERDADALPARLPQREAAGGATLLVAPPGRSVPDDVDIPIVRVADGAPPPPRCAAVLTLTAPGRARLEHGGATREVRVEAVSAGQALTVAGELAARAAQLGQRIDGAVAFADLPAAAPSAGSLATSIGSSGGEAVVVDLVADGPHAVVIGVTGAGKSELLTTWVAGMCLSRTAREVSFLLVDFKGGRTFDALAGLPHVAGVLTDLDDAEALRAVESLRAEIRHREGVLAAAGAREIGDDPGILSRLVIVVDEYAALVAAHPGLHELFGDIAARGRALGMHLVLASQRAAGSFRDAVLANAPLRIALRVTDAADSRAVLGTDEAAHLPGAPSARGVAFVRRAADSAALRVRVARCAPGDLAAVAGSAPTAERARAPWLPALPALVPLSRVAEPGRIALGLVDEPEHQRQPALLLPGVVAAAGGADAAVGGAPGGDAVGACGGFAVVGASGSGRTTLLRTVAAQHPRVVWVPADPEGAWDALAAVDAAPGGTALLVDDADVIAGRLPAEYAAEWLARLERAAREARGREMLVVVAAARVSGALSRTIELLPGRALLPLASRADHVAAGGESADYAGDQPPGRGRWGRRLVQFAMPDAPAAGAAFPAAVPGSARGAGQGAGPSAVPDAVPGAAAGAAPGQPRFWRPGRTPTALVLPPGVSAERFAGGGVRLSTVDEAAASAGPAGATAAGAGSAAAGTGAAAAPGSVVWGTPEAWLGQWRLLAAMRAACDVVIAAECAPEYRSLTGRRELPPYASPGADRAWLLRPGGDVARVVLPR